MFRYSICDPLKKEPIEMGEIERGKILDIVERFPWTDLLNKMDGANENDIHFSPSLEIENTTTRHGLAISIVDTSEFYIFYKRPKKVTRLLGLIKSVDNNFLSDRTGQTIQDVKDAVSALISDDMTTLERRWG